MEGGVGVGREGSTGGPRPAYPLFSLRKLASIRAHAKPLREKKEANRAGLAELTFAGNTIPFGAAAATVPEEPLHFTCVAFGGFEGHQIIAMACSNDYLLFRYVGESGVPMVRHLAWFKEPAKQIVAMDFNPTGQWLLCVTGDSTLIMIPVYFLMQHRVPLPNTASEAPAVPAAQAVPSTSSPFSSLFSRGNDDQNSQGKGDGTPKRNTSFPSLMKLGDKSNGPPPQRLPQAFPSLMNFAQNTGGETKQSGTGFGSLNDITVIKAITRAKIVTISSVLWWHPCDGGDFAIVATNRGRIAFVDLLHQREVHVIRVPHHITKVDKVETDSYTYLLIYTRKVYFKLLIEQKISDHPAAYETILLAKNKIATQKRDQKAGNVSAASSLFSLAILHHFSNQEGLRLALQRTERRGPLISAYNTNTNTLEVYGADLAAKFALFVYQLPVPATHVHLTDHLTFVVGRGDEGSCIYVVSNWNAATSAEPHWYYKHHKDSVMQEFQLGEGQNVRGIFTKRSSGEAKRANQDKTVLPGLLLWTADTVYECRQDQSPESIFYQLVGTFENSEEAESLGKTMGLDVLGLYEEAADRYFDNGYYDQALGLYHSSHVDSGKLIQKFAQRERMPDIIEHLSLKLQAKDSLSVNERRLSSDILFKAYLYCCLNPPNKSAALVLEKDFRAFLRENTDYDAGTALNILRDHGCTADFLLVARSRGLVERAMNILIHHGCFYINQKNIQLLRECGSGNELKVCEGGVMLRCLPPDAQVKYLLEDISTLPFYIRHISPLLPYLRQDSLMDLAVTLDPVGDVGLKIYSLHTHLYLQKKQAHLAASYIEGEQEPELSRPEELMELFIVVLLYISLYYCHNTIDINEIDRKRVPSPVSSTPALHPATATPNRSSSNTPTSRPSTPLSATIGPAPPLKKAVKITSVACGWNHSAAISDQGQLFTWGRNSSGELGHGQRDDAGYTQPKEVVFLNNNFVTHVAAGGQHTIAVAVATGGKRKMRGVYTWGAGTSGQLGHGDKVDRFLPKLVKDFTSHSIIEIAAGWAHSVFLTDMGVAFSCGHGEQGQLGIGSIRDVAVPHKIDTLSNIIHVACGYCHTVMLTDLGDVYTCGTNLWGQLGQADGEGSCQMLPSMVAALHGKTLQSVAAGSFHTIALTDLENIYVWGGGVTGMSLGDGDSKALRASRRPSLAQREAFRAAANPTLLPHLQGERVTGVSCGHHHTAVVTADGKVYVWGIQMDPTGSPDINSRKSLQPRGSIGSIAALGGTEQEWMKPTLVSALDDMQIMQVSCGEDYTLALSKNGQVFSWGLGTYGQLGLGNADSRTEPDLVEFSFLAVPTTPYSSSYSIASPLATSIPASPAIPQVVLEPAIEDFGQAKLERTLKEQYPKYCPTRILAHCKTFQNWHAAAVIYELLGDWIQALECRLEAITRACDTLLTSTTDAETSAKIIATERRHIMQILQNVFDEQVNERKAILILQILQHWHRRDHPTLPMEEFLLKHMDRVGYNLALILQLRGVEAHPFGGIPFTGLLYQAIALFCMKRLTSDTSGKHEIMREALLIKGIGVRDSMMTVPGMDATADEESLWTQICSTLPSEWDKRANIALPARALTESQEMIAFTCDPQHVYPRKLFFDTILPKFKALTSILPGALQMTVQLMLAEYHQKIIRLACPMCVYNILRAEQMVLFTPEGSKIPPDIKPW